MRRPIEAISNQKSATKCIFFLRLTDAVSDLRDVDSHHDIHPLQSVTVDHARSCEKSEPRQRSSIGVGDCEIRSKYDAHKSNGWLKSTITERIFCCCGSHLSKKLSAVSCSGLAWV